MFEDKLKGVSTEWGKSKYDLINSNEIRFMVTYTDNSTEMFECKIKDAKIKITDKVIKSIVQI